MQNILILNLKKKLSEKNVMWAEIIFASFFIEYNISIASTEQAGPLFLITVAKNIFIYASASRKTIAL